MIGRIPRRVGFAPFRGARAIRDASMSLRVSYEPATTGVRIAFSTPKRIGSAVTRNRLRRQLRELMRLRSPQLTSGWYLLAVEPEAVDKTWGQLGTTLDRLLHRAHLQAKQPTPATESQQKDSM